MIELISLGADCCVSYQLRECGYRKNAYPFDWIRSSLETCMYLIEYNFSNFLDKSDIYYTRMSTNYKFLIDEQEEEKAVELGYIFKSNLYKDLEFCHDFKDSSASNLNEIQQKYSKRIIRLYDILSEESKKNPVFIHYSTKKIPRDTLDKWNTLICKPLYIITPVDYHFDNLGFIQIVKDNSVYDSWQRTNFDWSKLFHEIFFKYTLNKIC